MKMEVHMKAICDGTKSKNDFIHETLDKYREMYVRTVSRLDVLKAVRPFLPAYDASYLTESPRRVVDMFCSSQTTIVDRLHYIHDPSSSFSPSEERWARVNVRGVGALRA